MEFKAPEPIMFDKTKKRFFLAGTIDMGDSEDWQKIVADHFRSKSNVDILNPRRDDWDPSWKQEFTDPQFYQQVTWELDALEKADTIIMNFLGTSKSPITLLELGLYATTGKILVCCPDEFYRSGNVHIVCNKYNIPVFKKLDDLLNYLGK